MIPFIRRRRTDWSDPVNVQEAELEIKQITEQLQSLFFCALSLRQAALLFSQGNGKMSRPPVEDGAGKTGRGQNIEEKGELDE